MRPLRPVLAGNSHAALDVLDLMLQVWDREALLVIAPPHGPKHAWQPSLADHAASLGVQVLTPTDVNDEATTSEIRRRASDLLLSVYYTQLFTIDLMGAIDGLRLNFHPSLLPRHRGTAPLIWAIAEGDEQTGVTVHELTRGVDTGPILWQRPLRIHPDDTGYTLHRKAALLVRAIVADLLRRLEVGRPLPEPVAQSGPVSVHTSRDPQLNRLDWTQPAARVRNAVRALADPLPGAHTLWRGREIVVDEVVATSGAPASGRPGMVTVASNGDIVVSTGEGALRLVSVRFDRQPQPAFELAERGLATGEFFG